MATKNKNNKTCRIINPQAYISKDVHLNTTTHASEYCLQNVAVEKGMHSSN